MAENIVTIMFPEYKDPNNFVTSEDWTSDVFYEEEALKNQIKEVDAFVYFFVDEDCRLCYDSQNVNAFLYIANTLPKFYPSPARLLQSVLKPLQDWRKNRKSNKNEEFNIHFHIVKDEIRTEIASRMLSSSHDSFLIATNVFGKGKIWELKKCDSICNVEARQMCILDVFDWLSKHHKPPRKYEWNEKHGENGIGAHAENKGDEVSVLESTKEHAEELLPMAIGEPMYDTLYCFDDLFGKYMEFKAGCKFEHLPANANERKYHSYHINDKTRVPKRVVDKIKILQKLSE